MLTTKTAEFYVKLRTGIDVDWCKNQTDRRFYQRAYNDGISFPKLFKDKGFDHARIRIKDYVINEFFEGTQLDLQTEIALRVSECNAVGLTPIVAFQAEAWKENPTSAEERSRVVAWWQNMARLLRGEYCAFNILIETTLIGKNNDAALNQLYRECVAAISAIDADRVCIICPGLISAPEELNDLIIPEGHVMAEAHFYAAGPSPTNPAKQWTIGTPYERELIRNKVRLMKSWRDRTGVPIWLGAIMFADFNAVDGADSLESSYSIETQCEIARFILGELRAAEIPMAINSDSKFLDNESREWTSIAAPLLDAIFS